MNIFVAKLSSETADQDLHELFGQFGEVTSAKVIIDRETGFSKKYGFVEMANEEDGNTAIEQLDETELDGSEIVVSKARPRTERRDGQKSFNNRY